MAAEWLVLFENMNISVCDRWWIKFCKGVCTLRSAHVEQEEPEDEDHVRHSDASLEAQGADKAELVENSYSNIASTNLE